MELDSKVEMLKRLKRNENFRGNNFLLRRKQLIIKSKANQGLYLKIFTK